MDSAFSKTVIDGWLSDMRENIDANQADDPNYWASTPETLITTSNPVAFNTGTGTQILNDVLAACETATREVIFVTCFWAKSESLEDVVALLRKLSNKALRERRPAIRVRLCMSSYSVWQKLTQTKSTDGYSFRETDEWEKSSSWERLGIPPADKIPGVKLIVKSVFIRPFSVMHPKFVLVDRKRAFLPSCNVSWENWFEGCIEVNGPIVGKLFEFWDNFWARGGAALPPLLDADERNEINVQIQAGGNSQRTMISHTDLTSMPSIPTVLLPSPHHVVNTFNVWKKMFCGCCMPTSLKKPPPTPLNAFLLRAIGSARKNIFVQTPNITSQPVITALGEALRRGVHVEIITSKALMRTEQLVTSQTTTLRAMTRFRDDHSTYIEMVPETRTETHRIVGSSYIAKQPKFSNIKSGHQLLMKNYRAKTGKETTSPTAATSDGTPILSTSTNRPEGPAWIKPGALEIGYFKSKALEEGDFTTIAEPVQTHIKLTIIDNEIVVLGSGNMDHASWYTSQELGVAFFSKELVKEILPGLRESLRGRVEYDDHDYEGRQFS